MPKQVYQINPATGEYLCPTTAYDNPMAKVDGVPYNIPRSCVEDEPPPHKEGFAIIREGNAWAYVVDHRGKTVYTKADGTPKTVITPGPIPDEYTLLVPGPFPKWSKNKWVEDTEAAKKQNNADVKTTLFNIDVASIRSIREWIATQPGAPQFIKDHEKNAQVQRGKLQK